MTRSAYVALLIERDAETIAEAERVTLAALARTDPEGARRKVLAALEVCDGNAVRARALLGAREGDWKRTVEALAIGGEISERWSARRTKKEEATP